MADWRFARFDELSPREVHDIFRARVAVFILEQQCLFQDIDGLDPQCWHLLMRPSPEGEIAAYCRLVPPGVKFAEPSIGRVITTPAGRGRGLGRAVVREAIGRASALWPGRDIRIGAQRHLEKFYGEFGFVRVSEPYDEDGIPHIDMLRRAAHHQEHA